MDKKEIYLIKFNAIKLIKMRIEGMSVKTISELLGLKINSVSYYYKKIGLIDMGIAFIPNINDLKKRMSTGEACENCGLSIERTRNARRFCCDSCRVIWWNDFKRNEKKK